eukprot:5457749-Lingulodinium_polyedra.AAC.1
MLSGRVAEGACFALCFLLYSGIQCVDLPKWLGASAHRNRCSRGPSPNSAPTSARPDESGACA